MPVLFKAAANDYTMGFCVQPVKMKRLLTSLPVWLILADMVYGFALNVIQSFHLSREPLPKDGLPVSPDIAFSGLQVLANGGMILIIGFGLLVLLQLNRTVLQRQILPIGVLRTLGLLAVLAFAVPSLWEWGWRCWIWPAAGSRCRPTISAICWWRCASRGWRFCVCGDLSVGIGCTSRHRAQKLHHNPAQSGKSCSLSNIKQAETFVKSDICRTRAGGCLVQSSALLILRSSENNKSPLK